MSGNVYVPKMYAGDSPSGRAAHVDVPLQNMMVAAFESSADYVSNLLFPRVPVSKRSDRYWTLDPAAWMRVPDTERAEKTLAKRVGFRVSSDTFYCNNYALATDNALEDLANADNAIRLRESGTMLITDMLLRSRELRVAQKVAANVSSISRLTGANAWDSVNSADIMTQVMNAKLSIFDRTGLRANTLILDYKSYVFARRNALAFERFKYVEGGLLSDEQLRTLFEIDNIVVARSQYNTNKDGPSMGNSLTSIWGPTALLAVLDPRPVSQKTTTYGLGFDWAPEGMPSSFTVGRQQFSGPGTENVEVIEGGYFMDEKVLSSELAFYINTKSGTPW